jgi:FHA domain
MEIDNNNNKDSESDDPTMELEPLSEAACNQMMQAGAAAAESDAVAETDEPRELRFQASASAPGDTASEIKELRDKLRYRVNMNSILRHGNNQLRERCDRLAEQVSSLLQSTETLCIELERSRRELLETKQQLSEARNNNQAQSVPLREPEEGSMASAVIEHTSSGARRTSLTRSPETALAPPGSEVQDCLVLLGTSGVESDTWVLTDGINTIGSGQDCDIRLESNFVSRHHAHLIRTRDGSILEDLNSTNGTYINSRRINKRALRGGDLVGIGKHRLRYRERDDHLVKNDAGKVGSVLRSGVT